MSKRGRPIAKHNLIPVGGERARPSRAKAGPSGVSVPAELQGAPSPPSYLAAEGKAEWRRVMPLLIATGMISKVDRSNLAGLCQMWARHVQAEKDLDDYRAMLESLPQKKGDYRPSGLTKQGEFGEVEHPLVKISRAALAEYHKMSKKFGLTPGDRMEMDRPAVPAVEAEQKPAGPAGVDPALLDG